MRMKVFSSALIVTMLSACGSGGGDFNDKWREGFISSCKTSAAGSGAPADDIAKVCECSADTVMKDYSTVERQQLRAEQVDVILDKCIAETGATSFN